MQVSRRYFAGLFPALLSCRKPVSSGFAQLTADIRAGKFPNTHGVLVEHDGQKIYEEYFPGKDERWGQPIGDRLLDANGLHDLRSVTKSVTSAVLGIALGDQITAALKRPIDSFLPKIKARPELEAVTLHHVLTMTAGLQWNEMTVPYTNPQNDELQMYATKEPVAMVLARPVVQRPGSAWYYNGGLTQVLAAVVTQLTGKQLDAYAKEVLFTPLGITEFEWFGSPGWDPPMPSAASGLRLRLPDLARFGSVYLNGGKWEGRQVVPAEWVRLSMQRHVPSIGEWSNQGLYGYGYQWWIAKFQQGWQVAAGVGNGNQRVFVCPDERVVVAIFAGDYNKFRGHSERIFRRVMEAIKS